LSRLFASPPTRQQPEPALLHARTLAALHASGTRAAFEQPCLRQRRGTSLPLRRVAGDQKDEADHQRANSLYMEICTMPSVGRATP